MIEAEQYRVHERRYAQRARCRIAASVVPEVWITDLSTRGCQFKSRLGLAKPGQRITLQPEGLGVLPATVRWARDGTYGVEFECPMHPSVVEHLLRREPGPAPGVRTFL